MDAWWPFSNQNGDVVMNASISGNGQEYSHHFCGTACTGQTPSLT
jgi:hypothetical protein